jgi:hypothetical protein
MVFRNRPGDLENPNNSLRSERQDSSAVEPLVDRVYHQKQVGVGMLGLCVTSKP